MSYKGRPKGSYGAQRHSKGSWHGGKKGFQHDTGVARENFESRSRRSQTQDLLKIADLAPDIQAYLHSPNRLDWANVDQVDARLIFSHKTQRQKAADLSKLAEKAPVEAWIKNTAQSDIQNVDTPPLKGKKESVKAKVIRKFKIVKKSEAEKLKAKAEDANAKDRENYKRDLDSQFREGKLSKEAYEKARLNAEAPKEKELAKAEVNDPIIESSHKLPSAKEILERAQELYQKENFKAAYGESMPEILPTKLELAEEGYLQKAKLSLMTSEDTVASRKVFDYVEGLKAELQKIGFDVVPLEGFDVSDLKY